MDREVAWWVQVALDGWRDRPGPRYQRLAAALMDAIDRRLVGEGTRVPAERALAAALGVSRGTVVACFDHLVAAGVLHRRQGAGTFVAGRPGWARGAPDSPTAQLLLRRMASGRESIDLSLSVPAGTDHLPAMDGGVAWPVHGDHGLDPAGLPPLREAIARHLTEQQQLPTEADQVIVTNGAQQGLALVHRALGAKPLVTTCPTYPGITGAFSPRAADPITVPVDTAGPDPEALRRATRQSKGGVVYLMPTGHNPTGSVMTASRREAAVEAAAAARATIVEDLSLADLVLDGDPVSPPLAALADAGAAIAVGSASKLLWAGLRVGWIRADDPLRASLLRVKAAHDLGTSVPAQALTAALLDAVDDRWLAAHRAALAARRDALAQLIADALPAWRTNRPAAGLSLWVELPVADADAFAHHAHRQGVTVAPGSTACLDGRHRGCVRLSFAEPLATLELAVERLASTWELHAADLAATVRA